MDENHPTTETIRAARAGDPGAWRRLVDTTGGEARAIARRMLHDATEADDMVQEIFLRLHRHFHRYDDTRPFRPWFRRLAVNHVLNRLRSRKKMASLDAFAEASGSPGPDPRASNPAEEFDAAERCRRVRAAIADLPEDYRVVVTLRYLGGSSVRDVAETLGIPEGTAKIRLHRARARLEEKLGDLL